MGSLYSPLGTFQVLPILPSQTQRLQSSGSVQCPSVPGEAVGQKTLLKVLSHSGTNY